MSKRPLNSRQKKFVENYVNKGLSIAESVRLAGYAIKSGRVEDASSYGCKLLRQDRVKDYVSKLREKAFSREALSYAEKRAFLARAVRTPVGELHEASDLAQEVTITESKEGTSRKVKAVDKLRALELDSKLAGDFYSDREPQANNPFLFIVSLGKSAGDPVSLPSPAPTIEIEATTLD
jgi:hypothetical protein